MILRTFAHLPSIGLAKEKEIWNQGVHTWSKFDKYASTISSVSWSKYWAQQLKLLEAYVSSNKILEIISILPQKLHWRILPLIASELVFLDAEMINKDEKKYIFMVTCQYQNDLRTFVEGFNLNQLKNFLANKKYLVTFGGTKNDLPLIYREFKKENFHIHIDLKNLCQSVHLKGGLKAVEKQLNIKRKNYGNLSGKQIPKIWNNYLLHKEENILTELKQYNTDDVINLPKIMQHCWAKSIPDEFLQYEDCQLKLNILKNPYT